MKFEKDIFISYAHIDNEALRKDETGWVADLHRALEIRLSQLLGERPNIWRDKKLQGNDFFGDEIIDQFPNTAILLSIISPRYMKSEWCIREIEQFKKVAESNLGLRIGNKSRIIKVIKTPVPISQHPDFVRDVLGYEFYTADYETGKHTEYSQAPEAGTEREYWQKLDDLAHDIAKLITEIRNDNSAPSLGTSSNSKAIYLAEVGTELRDERDNIKRELVSRGYAVYPDKYLPPYFDEYVQEATELLNKCK
ncbi:MAG TPA: hypothetical protein DCQ31_10465, partial [Bacteroidales bacterium]|nr:hypothetical protein [Bacteroidales bacterium]